MLKFEVVAGYEKTSMLFDLLRDDISLKSFFAGEDLLAKYAGIKYLSYGYTVLYFLSWYISSYSFNLRKWFFFKFEADADYEKTSMLFDLLRDDICLCLSLSLRSFFVGKDLLAKYAGFKYLSYSIYYW